MALRNGLAGKNGTATFSAFTIDVAHTKKEFMKKRNLKNEFYLNIYFIFILTYWLHFLYDRLHHTGPLQALQTFY